MRVSVLAGMLCFFLVSVGNADPASAAIRQSTNIPAEPLDLALKTLAKERQFQVLFRAEVVRDLRTGGAVGEFTPEEALTKVLSGTGLSYKYLDANTVTVFSTAAPAGVTTAAGQDQTNTTQDNSKEAGKKSSQDFLVAQATPGQTSSDVSVEKNDEEKKKAQELQVVIVTGSRIPTAAGQQTLPVLSYTHEDIERSGQSTLGDFLNTLPDVSNFTNGSVQLGYAGVETVRLHGLPIGTTLVLLDGRRLETNVLGFFDLSNIPLSAIERVEVLPVGASAIYGADAIGGAVNTILRKNFDGFEVNANVNHASGVTDTGASFAWGRSWERGSVSFIGSYLERGELLGTEREPTSLTHVPADFPILGLQADSCAPGNVYSVDGSNLPGLSSPEAGIPAGISGKPTIGQFAATAGKLNVCNFRRYIDIAPQVQREGALFSAHYEVAKSVDLFTEVLLSHGHLRNQTGPQISATQAFGGTVAADNPYNPFGQAVNVSFAYPGTGQDEEQSTSFIRPLVGVRGTLSEWHYEATAYLSRNSLHDVSLFADPTQISAALNSSDPATALNPFTSGAPGTQQLMSSLANPTVDNLDTQFNDRIVGAQGILRGPVLYLPAGALQAVIGSEYNQDRQESINTGAFASPPLHLRRNTYAVFGEARVPLLAEGENSQRLDRLALTLAGRYDHSNDYGGKATWQSGFLWRANEALSLSGGYGLSYQAPQLSEISGPQTASTFPVFYPDPFRGNQTISYPVAVVFGSNFNLKPETGDSLTLGLQYSSRAVAGLHASLTWYALRISNYIAGESIPSLLANPGLFPGAVTRAPATPQDQQQGFLGVITQINDVAYNFGDLRINGFDADISYAVDTRIGQITPSLAVANIYKWQSAIAPNAPAIDAVSKATFFGVGWAPRWKGTASLAWKQGPFSTTLAGRYIGRYLDYQDFVPNTNKIGNSWILDVNTRFEAGQALARRSPWFNGAYVALGAVNLLNKTPPFSYTGEWYDPSEYDIRGRYVYLNVGLRF